MPVPFLKKGIFWNFFFNKIEIKFRYIFLNFGTFFIRIFIFFSTAFMLQVANLKCWAKSNKFLVLFHNLYSGGFKYSKNLLFNF